MGMHADRAFGYVYSVGEDCKFRLTDVSAHSVISDLQPGNSPLKYLLHNEARGVFFIGDAEGFVYIYNQNIVSLCKLSYIFLNIAST
jgi:hypothetical protein